MLRAEGWIWGMSPSQLVGGRTRPTSTHLHRTSRTHYQRYGGSFWRRRRVVWTKISSRMSLLDWLRTYWCVWVILAQKPSVVLRRLWLISGIILPEMRKWGEDHVWCAVLPQHSHKPSTIAPRYSIATTRPPTTYLLFLPRGPFFGSLEALGG